MKDKMPVVLVCDARTCAYNHQSACRSSAINVGGPEPLCDTFLPDASKGGSEDAHPWVGACKVAGCVHNRALLCTAGAIRVQMSGAHPLCAVYAPASSQA